MNEMPLNCFTIYIQQSPFVFVLIRTHSHTRLSARRTHQKIVRIFVGCLPPNRGGGGADNVLILDLINSSALPNEMEGYLSVGAIRGGRRQAEQVARNLVMIYE